MSTSPKLCLNMIVKNEMLNLPRCLASVADHIDCFVIGDTGSIDGSPAYIEEFFHKRGIQGEIYHFSFHNFEQARNEALGRARHSALDFDYIIFLDADMELMVQESDFRCRLDQPAYEVMQRCGISYWNTRIVRRSTDGWYKGVTHEYLDVGKQYRCSDIWFLDHASGANRVEKYERDIRLLLAGLAREPENSRYWFYLAQSYRDSGRWSEAMDAYGRRVEIGGWAEETWFSVLQQARCALKLGQDGKFIQLALKAYDARPIRSEPLYELAQYYRKSSMHVLAYAFCRMGSSIKWPESDVLFIEDFVYRYGFKEELSISGYYSEDPVVRAQARQACEELILDPESPQRTRDLARDNLIWHVQSAVRIMPATTQTRRTLLEPTALRVVGGTRETSTSPSRSTVSGAEASLSSAEWDALEALCLRSRERLSAGLVPNPAGLEAKSKPVALLGGQLALATMTIGHGDNLAYRLCWARGDGEVRQVSQSFVFDEAGTTVAPVIAWSENGRVLRLHLTLREETSAVLDVELTTLDLIRALIDGYGDGDSLRAAILDQSESGRSVRASAAE